MICDITFLCLTKCLVETVGWLIVSADVGNSILSFNYYQFVKLNYLLNEWLTY